MNSDINSDKQGNKIAPKSVLVDFENSMETVCNTELDIHKKCRRKTYFLQIEKHAYIEVH